MPAGATAIRVSLGGLVYTVAPDPDVSETRFVLLRATVVSGAANAPIRSRPVVTILRPDGSPWKAPWLLVVTRADGRFAITGSEHGLYDAISSQPLPLVLEMTAEGHQWKRIPILIADFSPKTLIISLESIY